jgi:hypothetical protein
MAPHLDYNKFDLFILDTFSNNNISFNPKNILANQHLFEGKRVLKYLKKLSNDTQSVLDQTHCVCDHHETQNIWKLPRYQNLASTHFQTRFLYENLEALGLLDSLLKRKLKICSEISFLSFDTEALNKNYIDTLTDTMYNTFDLKNEFNNLPQKNIICGKQQLYIIGLCDCLDKQKTFIILKKYFPSNIFQKIVNYVISSESNLKSHLSWEFCKSKLQKIDLENCALELLNLYENNPITDDNIKTFHISNNKMSHKATEPTHANTTQMIYRFLTYIYQRNILASIIKFIMLKSILYRFESSQLCQEKQGIFYLVYSRLQEIIFESILTAFNGQNYDNLLLSNSLVFILSKLNEQMKIYKKGASYSTMTIFIRHNLNSFPNILNKEPPKQKSSKNGEKNKWLMKLYIKDFRNLVASNMSLDKIGKLFNLKVSKLCFPYEQATSVKKIKKIKSLNVNDEQFWKDTFSNKTVDLTTRLEAQTIYDEKKFENLYAYGEHYLVQDCLLLHSVVLTLFRTYLEDSINIYLRRNFSQSNLAYQQFFIIEPSKQIKKNLAPKGIKSTFYNYFVKQAVTGGLCTAFVHGEVNRQTIINEHLNNVDFTNIDPQVWPNFANINHHIHNHTSPFNESPSGISTIDIRSLYPSAAVKAIPVGLPLCFSRLIPEDFEQFKDQKRFVCVNQVCKNARDFGNHDTDYMHHINATPHFKTEFYALNFYLSQIPSHVKILRFQSSFTALGQLYFTKYPLDGFLSYWDPINKITYIKLIQYHSLYYHGHRNKCPVKNNSQDEQKAAITNQIKSTVVSLADHFKRHFFLDHVDIEYVEISDCDFFMHKIPKQGNFCASYKKSYSYNEFLRTIFQKNFTGFLLVKNLTIKKSAQNPIFGFVIQKVNYGAETLSDYTRQKVPQFKSSQRVVSLNKAQSFMVISTEYMCWLNENFGFESPPDIYHALIFQLDTYLKPYIENKLLTRKTLKEKIKNESNGEKKQIFEIQSELIKLMLNSCYGFTLTNVTSNKFKIFELRKQIPKGTKTKNRVKSCIQFGDKIYLAELKKTIKEPFETLLGQVGSYILYHSKIILAKRLNFLLKFLNPSKAQLLYMDTDSAHFLVKHENFIDNVDDNLKPIFQQLYNKHFDSSQKISGIWVKEGFFEKAHYIGEKSYVLSNDSNDDYVTHMKGLNQYFQKQFVEQKIDPQVNPIINYTIFQKSNDCLILKTCVSKNVFQTYVPIKRYFINATGSLPLDYVEKK